MQHAEAVMGTVVSIDVRTSGSAAGAQRAIDDVVTWLHWVDATFSTYRPESEISRLDRHELAPDECHPHVREILVLCDDLRTSTAGYFDAWASGHLDPSGVVKGWSIERASDLLAAAGWPDHAIDGGGDVRLRGGTGSRLPATNPAGQPRRPPSPPTAKPAEAATPPTPQPPQR
ncbi:MAG: FAD:protein FMN transferase [Acidimicrobiales bacterium]